MIPLVQNFLQKFQFYLTPFYGVMAWLFCAMIISSLILAIADVIKKAKKMHQIPCNNCEYFTNNYRLKCTVKPNLASTEMAINCSDYCVKKGNYFE